MCSSRSGGIIAATWAALLNFGLNGYIEASKEIFDTLAFIVDGIRKIKGKHEQSNTTFQSCLEGLKTKIT